MTPFLWLLLLTVATVTASFAFVYYRVSRPSRATRTVRCPSCNVEGEFAASGPLECHACAHKFSVDLRGRSSSSVARTVFVPVLLIMIVTSILFLDFPQNRSTMWLELVGKLMGPVVLIVAIIIRKKTLPPGTSLREY